MIVNETSKLINPLVFVRLANKLPETWTLVRVFALRRILDYNAHELNVGTQAMVYGAPFGKLFTCAREVIT